MKEKILIVEDEKKLADVMALYLKKEGYQVITANDGIAGEEAIEDEVFDLIVLDVMIPGKDGWSLLRKIKSKGETPVIMTTARGEEEDRVFGLELGAIDYMVKPISMKELMLRVKLRINSSTNYKKGGNIVLENLVISQATRTVTEDEEEVLLTPKEFELLLFFCQNPEQVFKREQLLNRVWSYEFMGDTRTVDTHIKNLREKINYCEKHIKTIWGVGYKLQLK